MVRNNFFFLNKKRSWKSGLTFELTRVLNFNFSWVGQVSIFGVDTS